MEKLKSSILHHISKAETQKAFDIFNNNIESSSHLCNMLYVIYLLMTEGCHGKMGVIGGFCLFL